MKSPAPTKPKILMVADQPNWAYDHMARWVSHELKSKYDFYIDYCGFNLRKSNHITRPSLKREIIKRFSRLKASHRRKILSEKRDYDLVCFLGWYFPFVYDFRIRSKGMIQGIFTDGFPPKGHTLDLDSGISMKEFVNGYLENAVSVLCGSKLIHERYKGYIKNAHYCTGGIDTQLFKPMSKKRKDKNTFIVGWTGDPRRSFKGFYDFVIPAVEKASLLRSNIFLKSRFKGPYRTLPGFYEDVDVLLIASTADAGPSSFLEAGACGVPVISTRIGFPAEAIRHGENGLFVERSVDDMAKAILYLYDHRDLLDRMSKQIRLDIAKDWDYKVRAGLWDRAFQEALAAVSSAPQVD